MSMRKLLQTTIFYMCACCTLALFQPTDLRHIEDDLKGSLFGLCFNIEDCDDTEKLYICASDGKTYDSRCAFRKAACREGSYVEFRHVGECSVSEKCIGQRDTALKKASGSINKYYIPVCKPDGTFASVQCHEGTGYCWCSSPSGMPVAGTPQKGSLPDCKKVLESSKPKESEDSKPSYRPKEGCEGQRRIRFNKKLIRSMTQDAGRENSVIDDVAKNTQKVLRWKFMTLDHDKNGRLTKIEYRKIQKLVRKNIKPRKCAKKFPSMCDVNSDHMITMAEWVSCFSTKKQKNQSPKKDGKKEKHLKLGVGQIYRMEPCKHDREQALEAAEGTQDIFIPSCDKQGYFKPMQCYGSKEKHMWYCFCVDSRTGTMLENSSAHNGTEKCIERKEWPKCLQPDKEETFLENLRGYVVTQSLRYDKPIPDLKISTAGKRAAAKIFSHLDQNNNAYLERREKKALRKFVRKNRKLRRCGGQIHTVCDSDNDKKISLKEFFTCLGLFISKKVNNTVMPTREEDLNPFEHYIKPVG